MPALIPFADFGEMIDPPSADVTAHVVEMLGDARGRSRDIRRSSERCAYLYAQQEPEGSWFGRWGVNHVYGTGAVLPALAAIGEPMDSIAVRRAVRWLVERQNHDGGFGEGCESYVDAQRARARPEHAVADRMGAARLHRRRARESPPRTAPPRTCSTRSAPTEAGTRRRSPAAGSPATACGEERGARIREGRELSPRLHAPLSPVPQLFSAARARPLSRRVLAAGRDLR